MGDLAPVQVAPGEALNEHLGGGEVGGDGHVVLVAQAANIGQIGLGILVLGVGSISS